MVSAERRMFLPQRSAVSDIVVTRWVAGAGPKGSPGVCAPGFRVAPTPATRLVFGFRTGSQLDVVATRRGFLRGMAIGGMSLLAGQGRGFGDEVTPAAPQFVLQWGGHGSADGELDSP